MKEPPLQPRSPFRRPSAPPGTPTTDSPGTTRREFVTQMGACTAGLRGFRPLAQQPPTSPEPPAFTGTGAMMKISLTVNGQSHHLEVDTLEALEEILPRDGSDLAQFCDLPERLKWVFLQFKREKEEFWCGKAAFNTALYAARMHAAMLRKAREMYKVRNLLKSADQVTAILSRKGPCKLRELQRSCNKRGADSFKPVLNFLQQQGRVRVDPDNRLQLIAQT